MKNTHRWLSAVGVGVMASGIAVAAQVPTSTTSREVINATGCVQRAGPDGSGGAAAGDSVGASFVLKGARVGPNSGLRDAPPATSPGTPSSTESTQATNTAEPGSGAPPREALASGAELASPRRAGTTLLRMVADRGVDLEEHVGHRVMVTGRLSSFAAPGGIASDESGQSLTVTKVSLISPSCGAGS
jgi:hypothetical protein